MPALPGVSLTNPDARRWCPRCSRESIHVDRSRKSTLAEPPGTRANADARQVDGKSDGKNLGSSAGALQINSLDRSSPSISRQSPRLLELFQGVGVFVWVVDCSHAIGVGFAVQSRSNAPMHIDAVPNRNAPQPTCWRESFREGKSVRKRTLANLSSLSDAQIVASPGAARRTCARRAACSRSPPRALAATFQAVAVAMRQLQMDRVLAARPSPNASGCWP